VKIVALLPMKANSERVKGKNFKNFAGKPLFLWILDSLLKVNKITSIVINTDAEEILKKNGLIESNKVFLRKRKKEICGDLISMNLIIEDDINNVDADIFLMTHTTNPLLKSSTIDKAISLFTENLENGEADSLFTVNKIQERFYDSNSKPINHNPNELARTQDLEPWFKENSNLYLFTKESFKKTNARIGTKPIMMVTEPYESTDIDTPDDWDLGEIVVEYYKRKDGVT
jgi:CMP-N-acetylneuraminic acid synthetase